MNKKYSILRAAVVAALGITLASPQLAMAGVVGVIETGKPIKFASELVNESTTAEEFEFSTAYTFGVDISAMAGRNISETSPVEIRLTLTNGATFSTTPTAANFKCDYAGIVGGQAANNVLAAGERTATFKLANGTIASTTPQCRLADGRIKLNNGQQDYTIVVSGYMKNGEESVSINTAGAFVTFGQACVMSVEQGAATIDVGNPSLSKKFISNLDTSKKIIQTALLGTFTYQAKSDATAHNAVSFVPTEIGKKCSTIVDKITITLSGTPLVSGMTAWVQDKVATNLCIATDGVSALVVSSHVTFKIDYDDAANATTALSICYSVNDNVGRIEKGKVSYELSKSDRAGAIGNLSITGDSVLTTFYKNGTSVKVLNIPEPNDTRDKVNIRIYNFGDTTAAVYGSLYADIDGDGVATLVTVNNATAIKIAEVPAKGVTVVQSTAMGTLYSLPTMPNSTAVWKGRAWMQVEGDSQNIRVQALIRSGGAAGALFNMSDRVLEDGGAFCRSGTNCKP
jgi:hypothetical protein